MLSLGIIELTLSQAAHEHIASLDAGSTAQHPTGFDDQTASESNVSSTNPPAITYPIMALFRNHTVESWSNTGQCNTPFPTTTGHDSEF
ncbi:hypothetical protein K503DRAFT_773503 [Rhizopogon vinicolor AM-OR11-026]|uniref:Uncharacterized protein n=1 Tax=Rhizopogon vinicolor AM-OR11-026 TaxID=1314800 RepID=A0A1B7MS36_9AGAM|nr:hypothetical protein K503DRAFT_773503 [Rhizopogon vinicolor AM-OR11-026]